MRRREPTTAPARAADCVFGVATAEECGERRFNHNVHWGVRGRPGQRRGPGRGHRARARRRRPVDLATVRIAEQLVPPATDTGPAAVHQPGAGPGLGHHAVYAMLTGLVLPGLGRW